MVLLARHEESIKARLWFAFQYTFPINLIQSFTSLESLWTSSSSLCQKLSKVFWFYEPWKLVLFIFFISSHFAKKNSPRTNRLNSFCVFLLPFPKGLTAWILLCLSSPLSKNSKRHSLRILLILSIPLYKIVQRTNRPRILLYPHSLSIKGLTAWDLCLNTLEGTSFVVQVEGTFTWVWLRTREGTSLVDQF